MIRRPTFSSNPDRVAAVQEKTARDSKSRKDQDLERLSVAASRELERCVAEGLNWPEIRERLARLK